MTEQTIAPPTEEEFLKEVNSELYKTFSNPEEYKKWGITDEQAKAEIEAYHKKFGVPKKE